MKTLKQHIQEAFKLGDDNFKSRNERKENSEVLEKILDILYIKKSIDDYWNEGFTDEDYDDIQKVIYEKFVKEYELNDPDKLMFVCKRGQCPKEYTKYYKKDNSLWDSYRRKLNNDNYIWSKRSFCFDVDKNDTEAILGKHGPFGGLNICAYKF